MQIGTNTPTTYTVASDAIGNPTSDGTWSYTWEKGRQLKQMSKTGTTATFKYNSEGLRVQKNVNGTVTNYTLHGKNIVHLTQGSNALHFWYDAQNRPAIVEWNNGTTTTKYAYIHNLQGDIVGIIDSSGNEVVKYTYDAWGKVLSTTGSLASSLGTVQPFRYRGYVYDVETGDYYCRSRQYRTIWGFFLNADIKIEENLYSYCKNNPISFYDKDGTEPDEALDSFLELYESTYGKPYSPDSSYSTFSIDKYNETVSEWVPHRINVFSGIMSTIVGAVIGGGGGAIASLITGVVIGEASIMDPNMKPGTHTHYRITQTQKHIVNVEVGNYHGYKTYQPKEFLKTKVEDYIVVDGKLQLNYRREHDTYWLYVYRDRMR